MKPTIIKWPNILILQVNKQLHIVKFLIMIVIVMYILLITILIFHNFKNFEFFKNKTMSITHTS